ncbi:MAG: SET domain-containing protein [Steroidobacteraceae bacterium]
MADVNEGSQPPPLQVRVSNVHGRGVFATRRIEKGERIVEYLGERVSHDEADRRYAAKAENDSHTFLFIVDAKTVIDAGVAGNDARFFNHSCDPNCESVVESRRVFIEALRTIERGEEMTYDYQIYRDEDDPENIDEVFACRCGFARCRGTMLWPPEPKKRRSRTPAGRKKKGAPAKRAAAGKKSAARGGKSAAAGGKAGGARRSAAGKSGRGRTARAGPAGTARTGTRKSDGKSVTRGKSGARVAKKAARRR